MKIKTPAMKLDLRIDKMEVRDGELRLDGVAGVLPCEASLGAAEARRLILQALRPKIILWALFGKSASNGK